MRKVVLIKDLILFRNYLKERKERNRKNYQDFRKQKRKDLFQTFNCNLILIF